MTDIKTRRKKRVRAKLFGTTDKPRLSVFRSLNRIYAQIINDEEGKTLIAAGSGEVKDQKIRDDMKGKTLTAYNTGLIVAQKAKEKGIDKVVFDRGGYAYHGRVKALAEGAKEGGLKF